MSSTPEIFDSNSHSLNLILLNRHITATRSFFRIGVQVQNREGQMGLFQSAKVLLAQPNLTFHTYHPHSPQQRAILIGLMQKFVLT